jgi:hypothetical protein
MDSINTLNASVKNYTDSQGATAATLDQATFADKKVTKEDTTDHSVFT